MAEVEHRFAACSYAERMSSPHPFDFARTTPPGDLSRAAMAMETFASAGVERVPVRHCTHARRRHRPLPPASPLQRLGSSRPTTSTRVAASQCLLAAHRPVCTRPRSCTWRPELAAFAGNPRALRLRAGSPAGAGGDPGRNAGREPPRVSWRWSIATRRDCSAQRPRASWNPHGISHGGRRPWCAIATFLAISNDAPRRWSKMWRSSAVRRAEPRDEVGDARAHVSPSRPPRRPRASTPCVLGVHQCRNPGAFEVGGTSPAGAAQARILCAAW